MWAQKEVDCFEAQAARGDLVAQEKGEKLARGLHGPKKKQLEALTAKVAETEAAAAAAKPLSLFSSSSRIADKASS